MLSYSCIPGITQLGHGTVLKIKNNYFMCVDILLGCIFVPSAHPQSPKEGTGSPLVIPVGAPCGHWELNPSPLEEQPMFLVGEPSLQPRNDFFLCDFELGL